MDPAATETGFCAADSAIMEKKDRSPNSAANTNPNVVTILALCVLEEKGEQMVEGVLLE